MLKTPNMYCNTGSSFGTQYSPGDRIPKNGKFRRSGKSTWRIFLSKRLSNPRLFCNARDIQDLRAQPSNISRSWCLNSKKRCQPWKLSETSILKKNIGMRSRKYWASKTSHWRRSSSLWVNLQISTLLIMLMRLSMFRPPRLKSINSRFRLKDWRHS